MIEEMKYWTLVAFVIAGCFFLVYPAAAPGGYTVSPLGDPPPEGGNDFTEISFWELSPRMMLVEMLLFISPVHLFPAKLFYSITVVTFLGYRRISRRNALDHDSRKRLYECIGQNPGISLGALIHASGVARGAAQYHLCRLKSMGMIVAVRQGGQVGYFKTGEGSARSAGVFIFTCKTIQRDRFFPCSLRIIAPRSRILPWPSASQPLRFSGT